MAPPTTSSPTTPNVWFLAPVWFFALGGIVLAILGSVPKIHLYQYYKSKDFENDSHGYFYYSSASIAHAYLAWGIVLIVFSAITLVVNIVSLVLIVRRIAIAPAFLLYSSVAVFIIWAILLICSLLVTPGNVSVFQLIGECLLIATSIAQLIYGAILVKRLRRSGLSQGLEVGRGQLESRPEQAEKAATPVPDPALRVPSQHREAYGVAR